MGALRLLVTGAAGTLGRAVVLEAARRGHRVRGLKRADGDLAEGLPSGALDAIDVVIHCAAAMRGDGRRDTVMATLALLRAMEESPARLVLAGTMSLYQGPPPGGAVIDEASPLEPAPNGRDGYHRAKRVQEGAVLSEALASERGCVVLRLGALWSRGRMMNAHLGLGLGPLLIRLGPKEATLPVIHLREAALALVLAAEAPALPAPLIVNAVSPNAPTRGEYLSAMGGASLPLPWRLLDILAPVLGALPGLGRRLPGLLRRPTLRARAAPARYDTEALEALGFTPLGSFEELFAGTQS